MKFGAQHEKDLMERVLACRNDPVRFTYLMYPWGQAGTPLAHLKGPRAWQLEELEALAEYTRKAEFAIDNDIPLSIYKAAMSSGRGPGKSALLAMAAHWQVSCHPGAQAIVVANTETQMRKKTFPEISRWISMSLNAHWFLIEGMSITPEKWLADLMRDQRKIDERLWNISGQTWTEDNADSVAGSHNQVGLMLLFDEASGIAPGVWDTMSGYMTDRTAYRYWLAASQMRRNSGRFYDLFHSPRFADWRRKMLSIRGMEGIDPQWVADFIATHGEGSDEVRVEVDGQAPVTDDSQFIATPDVRMAQSNKVHEDLAAPLIMGVDPAPRGRTVIRFRQGRNARDCCGRDTRTVMNGANNIEIALKVKWLAERYKPDAICIDFGQGTGVIDICRDTHKMKIVEVKFGEAPPDKDSEFATMAAHLWGKVRTWLPGGMIDMSDELFNDLTKRGWAWSGKEDGKKILEKKEDLKARGVSSPDDADALACTFAVSPPRRDSSLSQGAGRQARVAAGTTKWMTD